MGSLFLKFIHLLSQITRIMSIAFKKCSSLELINASTSMNKIAGAFMFAGLKSITSIILPVSIEKFGAHGFQRCQSHILIQQQSLDDENLDMSLEESDSVPLPKLLMLLGLWIILDYYDQSHYHHKLITSTILFITWVFLYIQIRKTSFNTKTLWYIHQINKCTFQWDAFIFWPHMFLSEMIRYSPHLILPHFHNNTINMCINLCMN